MTVHGSWTLDALVAAYGQYLHRARGLRVITFHRHARHVRRFVRAVVGDDPIDVSRIDATAVIDFMLRSTEGFRPKTVGSVATALRSFFRFLRAQGLSDGRLEAAVPSVARRRLTGLPLFLTEEELAQLLASSSAWSGPSALRDHAILVSLASLGLRC